MARDRGGKGEFGKPYPAFKFHSTKFEGPQGRATQAPGREGVGPYYDEAHNGLALQDGGYMAKPASGSEGLGVEFLGDIGPHVVDQDAMRPKNKSPR